MPEAFVLETRRTGRGKASPRGALAQVKPLELVTALLRSLPATDVEDVILGCATQTGEQGANPARTAALLAGLAAPGVTVNRFCASGLDAVNLAAAKIRAGDARQVLAGGVESVSRVPIFADQGPLYADPAIVAQLSTIHMGTAADLVASREGFTREALDDYALATRDKARRAPRSPSIVPLAGLDRDELLAYAPSRDELAALPAIFTDAAQDAIVRTRFPDTEMRHLHTRASSPALADAAALVVLGDGSRGRPRARIVATASTAGDPVLMLTAGQDAVTRVLARAGLSPADVDVFCFAEAFAALCLRFQRDLDIGHDRLNPDGGTIARGHAFGATGAILLIEAVELLERRQARYAVAAVSGAAGVGVATLIERVV